jgi:hypothetical protein
VSVWEIAFDVGRSEFGDAPPSLGSEICCKE